MPVTLEAHALDRALAALDRDAAIDARGALGWLGWEEEHALRLRRYDLQVYLWYKLPTKYLASLTDKRAVAAALGRLLDELDVPYAALCRAPETGRMLELWERDDPTAPDELTRLLEASGIEPPDTAKLAWDAVMGPDEAQARDAVAAALEDALEAGTLRPGTPGFARRRDAVVSETLARDGRLEAIHAERLRRWARRAPILAAVAELVATTPPAVDDAATVLEPVLWLLAQARDGIALTQTGALNRALVREAVRRWPQWWNERFPPPHQEADVMPLLQLHRQLRDMRLLRRSGRRLLATARARRLEATELFAACATALLAGHTFDASVGELAATLLLAGEPVDSGRLAERIQPVIEAEGWRAGAEGPSIHHTGAAVGFLLARAEPLGIVAGRGWTERRLTAAGRTALHIGLRARALGPATGL